MSETDTGRKAEAALLIRAVTGDLIDPDSDGLVEDPARFPWPPFLAAAFRHRVAAIAGRALTGAGYFRPDDRLEHVHDALLGAELLYGRRNAVLLAEAARLVGVLRSAGHERVAFRKGVYLAPCVYRDVGLRPMNDIDIFVDRREAKEVDAVLRAEGYRPGRITARGELVPLSRQQSVFWSMRINTLPTLHRPVDDPALTSVAVDVCFDLFLPGTGASIDADLLLDEAIEFELHGDPMPAFRPEHLVLDVAAHLYKESTTLRYIEKRKHQRMLQYVDLRKAIAAHDAFDWDVLVDTACRVGAAAAVYYGLANCEELFPGTVPAEVIGALGTNAGVTTDFLREYGQVDLETPLRWGERHIADRLFSDEEPAAPSRSPV
jgi:hypothetical protein